MKEQRYSILLGGVEHALTIEEVRALRSHIDAVTRAPPDPRTTDGTDHPWHVSINRFHQTLREHAKKHQDGERWPHRRWMYEAKDLSNEVPRMILLFESEREGKLRKAHQQCGLSAPEPIEENYLTCCLGVQCRKCPELRALDASDLPPSEIDKMKAWTCAGHIVSEGGDHAKEGYLLTVDDMMFWKRVYESMAADPEESVGDPCGQTAATDP